MGRKSLNLRNPKFSDNLLLGLAADGFYSKFDLIKLEYKIINSPSIQHCVVVEGYGLWLIYLPYNIHKKNIRSEA